MFCLVVIINKTLLKNTISVTQSTERRSEKPFSVLTAHREVSLVHHFQWRDWWSNWLIVYFICVRWDIGPVLSVLLIIDKTEQTENVAYNRFLLSEQWYKPNLHTRW